MRLSQDEKRIIQACDGYVGRDGEGYVFGFCIRKVGSGAWRLVSQSAVRLDSDADLPTVVRFLSIYFRHNAEILTISADKADSACPPSRGA